MNLSAKAFFDSGIPQVFSAIDAATANWAASSGEILERAIRNNVFAQGLYDTGALYNSFTVTHDSHGATIESNVVYAAVHEWGSSRGHRPRPFMRPAIEANGGRIMDEYIRQYRAQS